MASAKVYDFIWDTYCDWYIELTKTRLHGEDEEAKLAAQNVLCYVLTRASEAAASLHALHHRRRSGRPCPTRDDSS